MRACVICWLSALASAQPVPTPQPATTAVAPMPPPKRPLRVAAGSLLAGTVVLVGVSGLLLGNVDSGFQDLETTCTLRQCVPSDWASLQTRANAAYAILGVAGAMALADAVLWYLDARRPAAPRHARITPLGVTF
jgi:hypothetical protein